MELPLQDFFESMQEGNINRNWSFQIRIVMNLEFLKFYFWRVCPPPDILSNTMLLPKYAQRVSCVFYFSDSRDLYLQSTELRWEHLQFSNQHVWKNALNFRVSFLMLKIPVHPFKKGDDYEILKTRWDILKICTKGSKGCVLWNWL